MKRSSTASACGKVILVGEHAAVYGVPAIALPLSSSRLRAELIPKVGGETEIYLSGRRAPDALLPLVEKACRLLAVEPFAATIRGSSEIRAGSGLGSSAALCVTLLRLLSSSIGRELALTELASYANELECHFHGTPSGLDTAVVAFERVMLFQRLEPAQPNRFCPLVVSKPSPADSWPLLLIDSLERSPTFEMIAQVRPFLQGAAGERRLERFALLSAQVETGLTQGAIDQVAAGMNEAESLLDSCNVITPTMAELIAAARRVGALAAKPTGAGGGGNILVLLDPRSAERQLSELAALLTRHPLLPIQLDPQGFAADSQQVRGEV